MPNRAWTRLPFYLFLGGLLYFGFCSVCAAQECCPSISINNRIIRVFEPEPALETEMLALTNQYRAQKGLQELGLDDALTQIARQHSLEMAQQGFISHSQPSGNLRARMVRAGYRYEIARENVATAPTIAQAQNALIDSPGHEGNIIAPDVIRVGIGIARCPFPFGTQLYITEIFAAPREEYPTEDVQKTLASRIDELRQSGAGSMELNQKLEEMAFHSLNSIELPYEREQLQNLLTESSNDLPDEDRAALSRVQANVQVLHNPKNLSIPNYAPEGQARFYGAAVRQIKDGENQSAFLVLTLIGVAR